MEKVTCEVCGGGFAAKGLNLHRSKTHGLVPVVPRCSIEGCPDPRHAGGLCARHYSSAKRYGDPLAALRREKFTTDLERFMAKVDTDGPVPSHAPELGRCHVWTAHVSCFGYGRFGADGDSRPAHRWLYQHLNGPLPDDVLVCHHCDNRRCVNPAHLYAGSSADNVRDKMERGPTVHRRNLDQFQVRAIRWLHAEGAVQMHIADAFGISPIHVWSVTSRRSWKDLP